MGRGIKGGGVVRWGRERRWCNKTGGCGVVTWGEDKGWGRWCGKMGKGHTL